MLDFQAKAVSLDELSGMVRNEFNEYCLQMARNEFVASGGVLSDDLYIGCKYWIVEVYTDYLVCGESVGAYWKVPFTLTADGIQFAALDTWQAVEKEWIDATYPNAEEKAQAFFKSQIPEHPIMWGSEVKAVGNGKIEGHLVLFGSPEEADFALDFFRKSTDYEVNFNGEIKGELKYHHMLDPIIKDRLLGDATIGIDDAGIWLKGQMQMRDSYDRAIYKMAEERKLGFSSRAKGEVERVKEGGAYFIKRWPLDLSDFTMTPTPCDYRQAISVKSLPIEPVELKSLINSQPNNPSQPEAQPTETAQAVSGAANETDTTATEVKSNRNIQVSESEIMPDAQTPPVENERIGALESTVKGVSDQLQALISKLENLPVSQNPGYVTVDGGAADPEIKSFGDFLVSIKRGDTKRLSTVYGVKALGDGALSEDQGATGGYLIPVEYSNRLLAVVNQTSGIVPLVNTVNVGSSSGKIPSLDQFFAPTAGAGNSAFAGGLKATLTAEGGTFTETEPSFEMVEWNINKVGGVIYVTTEMMQDSPISIESLLTQYVGVAIANKEEYFIFRGNGVGQPLGILNSDAAVSTGPDTNNTFAYSDAAEILSRFKSVGGNPTWAAHPSTIPDLMRFEVGTGGAVWVANVQGQVPMSLLGYPVRFSEHLPQADNAGHVGLYDFSAYTLFRRSGISIAYSEHAAFTSGKVAWRFEERLDGKPSLKKSITLADPQGSYTVSPFSLFTD